jgi:hypothetical protein
MPMAFSKAFHRVGVKGHYLKDATRENPVYLFVPLIHELL